MRQEKLVHNPFMLMLKPDEVLAAVERSENLGGLKRRMCHPLDRPAPSPDAERARGARKLVPLDEIDD